MFIYYDSNYGDNYFLFFFCFVFLFCLKQYHFENPKAYENVLQIIVIWTVFEGLYGLSQLVDIFNSKNSYYSITGTFYNPGPFGIFIAIGLNLIIGVYKKTKKAYLLLAGIVLLAALISSKSRSAWFGFFISILVIYARNFYVFFRAIRKTYRCLIFSMISLCLLVMSFFIYHIKPISASNRILIWKISLAIWLKKPIGGYGYNSFERELGNYFINNSTAGKNVELTGKITYAFNEYIQILVSHGIIGLFIFFLILAYICSIYLKKTEECQCSLIKSVFAALITLVVSAFFSYPFHVLQIVIVSTVLLSIVLSKSYDFSVKSFKSISLIGLVGLVFFCVIMLFKNMDIDYAKRKARDASLSFRQGDTANAVKLFSEVYSKLNKNYEVSLTYAKVLSMFKDYNESNRIIEKTKSICTDPYLYIQEGDNYYHLGKIKESENSFIASVKVSPELLFPKYSLMIFYLNTKDSLSACEIAKKILATNVPIVSYATNEIQTKALQVSLLCCTKKQNE